jgi:hypothetical protein
VEVGGGTIDPTTRTGLTGGVSYRIGLILGLAVEPGVYYVQSGTVFEIPNTPMVSNGTTITISGKARVTFKVCVNKMYV